MSHPSVRTCRRLGPWLTAFLDEELTAAAAAEIAAHLERCPACAADCHALAAVGERLRAAWGPPSLSPEEEAALRAVVLPTDLPPRPSRRVRPHALVSTARGLAGWVLRPEGT